MSFVNILALICLILGFITGIISLKSVRSRSHPQAEITWKQTPLSPWRYETLNMVVISIHSLGLIGLTIMLLVSLANNGDATMFPNLEFSDSSRFLVRLFSFAGAAFTAYSTGVMIAFHFVQQWIKPAGYGISDYGMFYAGSLIPWISFSSYEIGPDDGLIGLYSMYSPRIRTWVLQPPAEVYASVLGLIQKGVPSAQFSDSEIPIQRSHITLVFAMTTLVAIALLPAVWGLMNDQLWVWGYTIVAFFIVQELGNKLILRFEGRVKATE